jgi:hypothetical protein
MSLDGDGGGGGEPSPLRRSGSRGLGGRSRTGGTSDVAMAPPRRHLAG